MACHSQFLVCFFLLTLFCRAQGLQISMERTSGNNLCGRLHCWQKVDMYGNIQAIIGVTIFEASKVHTESKLASIHLGVDNIILNQIKAEAINGTGSISRFQADLTLDFYNETDCENGTFLCELYFMNRNGQIEVIHQTVEPGNLNSKCDCAMTETCPWQESSAETFQSINEVKNQLTVVKEEQVRIKEEITGQMKEEQAKMKEEQAKMKEEQAKMKEELTARLKDVQAAMNEDLAERFREEQTNTKELTEILKEDQTKLEEELIRRLEEEQTKTKEELTEKLNKESFGLSKEINVLNNKIHELNKERDELKNELTELAEELNGLNEKLKELKKETMTEKNTTVSEEMDTLFHHVADIQSFLSCFRDTKVVRNKTSVMTNCTREMSQTCPKERFMLWGHSLALCDTETDRGGWIVIQRRTKGDVDFYRNWADYKNGFGTPDTDFWIGNDVIHNLTSQGYTELRVDLEYNWRKYFAHYSHFSVGDEVSKYKLSVSGYSGTANDSLAYHDGMKFSTPDQDHDLDSRNCAAVWTGAWWYKKCYFSNLNGEWGKDDIGGVVWEGIAISKSATSSEMKIRHV